MCIRDRMSDDQVVQYVKSAQQMGKNQKQITTCLLYTSETDMFIVRLGEVYPTNTHCLITMSEACMLTLEVGVIDVYKRQRIRRGARFLPG